MKSRFTQQLAAILKSGLKVGDRLKVFESRSYLDTPGGGGYIAPGYLLGSIEKTADQEQSALAEKKIKLTFGWMILPCRQTKHSILR